MDFTEGSPLTYWEILNKLSSQQDISRYLYRDYNTVNILNYEKCPDTPEELIDFYRNYLMNHRKQTDYCIIGWSSSAGTYDYLFLVILRHKNPTRSSKTTQPDSGEGRTTGMTGRKRSLQDSGINIQAKRMRENDVKKGQENSDVFDLQTGAYYEASGVVRYSLLCLCNEGDPTELISYIRQQGSTSEYYIDSLLKMITEWSLLSYYQTTSTTFSIHKGHDPIREIRWWTPPTDDKNTFLLQPVFCGGTASLEHVAWDVTGLQYLEQTIKNTIPRISREQFPHELLVSGCYYYFPSNKSAIVLHDRDSSDHISMTVDDILEYIVKQNLNPYPDPIRRKIIIAHLCQGRNPEQHVCLSSSLEDGNIIQKELDLQISDSILLKMHTGTTYTVYPVIPSETGHPLLALLKEDDQYNHEDFDIHICNATQNPLETLSCNLANQSAVQMLIRSNAEDMFAFWEYIDHLCPLEEFILSNEWSTFLTTNAINPYNGFLCEYVKSTKETRMGGFFNNQICLFEDKDKLLYCIPVIPNTPANRKTYNVSHNNTMMYLLKKARTLNDGNEITNSHLPSVFSSSLHAVKEWVIHDPYLLLAFSEFRYHERDSIVLAGISSRIKEMFQKNKDNNLLLLFDTIITYLKKAIIIRGKGLLIFPDLELITILPEVTAPEEGKEHWFTQIQVYSITDLNQQIETIQELNRMFALILCLRQHNITWKKLENKLDSIVAYIEPTATRRIPLFAPYKDMIWEQQKPVCFTDSLKQKGNLQPIEYLASMKDVSYQQLHTHPPCTFFIQGNQVVAVVPNAYKKYLTVLETLKTASIGSDNMYSFLEHTMVQILRVGTSDNMLNFLEQNIVLP